MNFELLINSALTHTWCQGKVPSCEMLACKVLDSLRGCYLPATTIRTVITAAATKQPDEANQHGGTPAPDLSPSPSTTRVFLYNRRKLKDEVLDLHEALRALRAYSLSLIPETVELSCRVDLTMKKNKIRDAFRGTLIYPHRFGRERKILVFADQEDIAAAAHNAGADIIGGEELISKVEKKEEKDFDMCMCSVTMFPKIKHLQKVLKAKMPNPRRGTVSDDMADAIVNFKQSTEYKCDKLGYLSAPVGKLDFADEHIAENIATLMTAITSHRNQLPKASFVKRAVLASTYGPGFPLDIRNFLI